MFNFDNLLLYSLFLMFVIFSLITLLSALIYYSKKYHQEKHSFLTLGKLTIFAFFLAIFVIQAYLTAVLIPSFGGTQLIPFSIDSVTVITVGFIFGPLEGIFFGATADLINTFLIHHWAFELLPFFTFPMIGLLAGFFGRSYFNNNRSEVFLTTDFFIFQAVVLFIVISFIVVVPIALTVQKTAFDYQKYLLISAPLLGIISVAFLELIFYLLWKNPEISSQNLNLFVIITLIYALSRIYGGLIIRPFTQYYYFGHPYFLSLTERLIDSMYLIPIGAVTTWLVVKASIFALNNTITI